MPDWIIWIGLAGIAATLLQIAWKGLKGFLGWLHG